MVLVLCIASVLLALVFVGVVTLVNKTLRLNRTTRKMVNKND